MRSIYLVCVIVTFVNNLPGNDALWCYQCGTGADAPACDLFIKSPLWRPYEVQCSESPDHVCVKTWKAGDPTSEIRACTPAENTERQKNPTGCTISRDPSLASFCICDSDLCNGASALSVSVGLLSLTLYLLRLVL